MLILKNFEAYSNSDKSNQVLKKLVKLLNSQNVNIIRAKHTFYLEGVFFCVYFEL